MNRKLVHTLFLMVLMAMIALSASVARADLIVTLDNPIQKGFPGDTLKFTGTLTATEDISFIIGAACTVNSPFMSCNPDPFVANAPFFMSAGQSTASFEMFDVTLSNAPIPLGDVALFFYVDYLDANGNPPAPGQNPSVNVTVTTVPEPASMLLLGSGLSGLVGVIRRKRQS